MIRLTPVKITPEDNIREAIKGRHDKLKDESGNEYDNSVKKTLKDERDSLVNLFVSYDKLSTPCRLEQLLPAYTGSTVRQNLDDAYRRESKQMVDFWNKVAKDDKGVAIVCPYCHDTIVTDIDHYIPRKEMPEYSVFLHNLIPLCHQCNLDKHDDWTDKNGKRVFFNVYFDDVPQIDDYLELRITISKETHTPKATVTLKPAAAGDSDPVKLVKSTVMKLGLVSKYWQTAADNTMRRLVLHLESEYKNVYEQKQISKSVFWSEQKNVLVEEINSMTDVDFITRFVYANVIVSKDFQNWVMQ